MIRCIINNNNHSNNINKINYLFKNCKQQPQPQPQPQQQYFTTTTNNDALSNKKVTFKYKPSQEFEKLKDMTYQELKETVDELGSEVKVKSKPSIDHSHLSFIDKIKISLKAGDGGGGCISFYRAKYIPEGPPDGGNGGDGANIIIRADFDNNNLSHLKKSYRGQNGNKGMGGRKTGKTGDDIILHVPVGTVIRELVKKNEDGNTAPQEFSIKDSDSIISKKDPRYDPSKPEFSPELYLKALSAPVVDGKIDDEYNVINHLESAATLSKREKEANNASKWIHNGVEIDLNYHGQEIIIAQGGIGGKGNLNFASGSNRSPEYAQSGTKGELKHIEMELKIIADFGLVGYPNAGKSTLLSVISNAIPNIQDYAFTTLNPYVGVIDFQDVYNLELKDRIKSSISKSSSSSNNGSGSGIENLSKRKRKINPLTINGGVETSIPTSTIADLPGILEGAHLNLGLGLDFLRHIERTKAIVYVIDMSNNSTPVFWDRKKLKVISNRYSYIKDEDDLVEAKKEIKSKIYDDQYRAPWKDFASLLEELENYKPGLTNKPSVIIANKMDREFADSHLDEFKKATKSLLKGKNWKIIPISAKNNEKDNIILIKNELKNILKEFNNNNNLTK